MRNNPAGTPLQFPLTAGAVKKDSEGGVHPEKVFGFVVLECTPLNGIWCGRGLPRSGYAHG
ncbi:MAG: hypothetical protein IJG38_14450 [Thermoguttaceae bacterium]|nr:hypothetical protein [Thermoguttaceae bacterium]MBQ6616576.1 hypothetical protein [Thermoguttaceae bacterium]